MQYISIHKYYIIAYNCHALPEVFKRCRYNNCLQIWIIYKYYTQKDYVLGENKRWSLTSSFTQMLRRSSGSSGPSSLNNTVNQSTGISENQLEAIGHGSGYR